MRIAFRFRTIPFVAMLLLVALGVALGQWQDRRAAQKIALQARLAEGAHGAPLPLDGGPQDLARLEYHPVRVTGRYDARWPVFLDNRPYQGRAGFYVLMPLKIDGSDTHVLVARGWLPVDPLRRDRLPAIPTPAGSVTIDGVVRAGIGRAYELGTAATLRPGAIVQNLAPAQFGAASGLAMHGFVVEQTGAAPDQLVRDWPAPALNVEKHQGYAFQWYALAVMAFLYFVMTGFRRGTK